MKEFIIIFRECLEAGLIVGIIYTYININNIVGQKRNIWLGVFGGIIASVLVGCVFFFLGGKIPSAYEKLFEGISMYITAGFLFYVIFWLSKKVSSKTVIESSVQQSISKNESWGLFLLILFAILREGFEIIILLFNDIKSGNLNFMGVSLGFLFAVFIIYLIFVTGKKIPIKTFFASTTLLLVFIAAGLIAYGTHEIEEYIVESRVTEINNEWKEWEEESSIYLSNEDQKKSEIIASKIAFSKSKGYIYNKDKDAFSSDCQIARVWDILKPKTEDLGNSFYTFNEDKGKYYHILHDKGKVGDFLKGFFGYNSNPNYIEFILWLFFLIFGIKKWADFYYIAHPKK